MCDMIAECGGKHDTKEDQLKHILSENLRMLPDKSDEVDKYGPYIDVEKDDDDLLHEQEHNAFMSANTLRPQYKAKLQAHVKKHKVAYNEKIRMGLVKDDEEKESKEESETTEDNTTKNYKAQPRKFGDRQVIDSY